MKLAIIWSREAGVDLVSMSYETASAVGAQIHAFADGEAEAEVVDRDDPRHLCIRAEGGYALVWVSGSTLHVSRIIAYTPLPHRVALLDEPDPPDSE